MAMALPGAGLHLGSYRLKPAVHKESNRPQAFHLRLSEDALQRMIANPNGLSLSALSSEQPVRFAIAFHDARPGQ